MEKNVNMEVVGTDKCNSISGRMLKPIESLKNILGQIISQKLSNSSEGSSECWRGSTTSDDGNHIQWLG